MTGEGSISTEIAVVTYQLPHPAYPEIDVARAVEMSLDELGAAIRGALGLSGSFARFPVPCDRGASRGPTQSIFRVPPSVGFYSKYSGYGPPPPARILVQTNPFLTFLSPRFDFEVGG